MPRQIINLAGEPQQITFEFPGHDTQNCRIDAHAHRLDVYEDIGQRQLDFLVDLLQPFALDFRSQKRSQLPRAVGRLSHGPAKLATLPPQHDLRQRVARSQRLEQK